MLINYNKIYFSLQRNIHKSYYALFHPEINICMTLNLFFFVQKLIQWISLSFFFIKLCSAFYKWIWYYKVILKLFQNGFKMHSKLWPSLYSVYAYLSHQLPWTGLIHNYRDSNPWPHPSCALSPCHALREIKLADPINGIQRYLTFLIDFF